jgi:UDP-N-acetylmuramoyl-tripeptide--D-alanyl-D-alanine ligase
MAKRNIDILIGVRGLAQSMTEGAQQAGIRSGFMASADEAGEWLAHETRDGDVVLLKASRGVKLERALEIWQAHIADRSAQKLKAQHN